MPYSHIVTQARCMCRDLFAFISRSKICTCLEMRKLISEVTLSGERKAEMASNVQ